MAAKRAGRRRDLTPGERRALARAKRAAREARADVRRLLKRTKAGTLDRKQLQTGLAEVETDLYLVMGFHYFKL